MVARPQKASARISLALRLCRIFCCALVVVLLPVYARAVDDPPPSTGELCRLPAIEEALSRYRLLAAQDGWPPIPAGPALREGDRNERIPFLRQRLVASSDLVAPADQEDIFDGILKEAVQRFQLRHGLTADGLVGAKTLRELNVPLRERIRQLAFSLERCRLLPPLSERRHILVNIPDFTLKLFEDDKLRLSMPVIVGRYQRQTPAFNSRISSLILNPTWTVPQSIATKDLLPKIKKDPGYLKKSHFRVFRDWKTNAEIDPATIDWANLSPARFPYRLRQDPGPANALGRVKFLLPKPYSAYLLHDTPARELFQQDTRALSSGCIRLAKPLELAVYLLEGTPLGSIDALTAAISSEETQSLAIPSPIAVYIVYITAWVDLEGIIQFRPDIYRGPAPGI